jgi:hypothetical protein
MVQAWVYPISWTWTEQTDDCTNTIFTRILEVGREILTKKFFR